jgi:hypothetical protein
MTTALTLQRTHGADEILHIFLIGNCDKFYTHYRPLKASQGTDSAPPGSLEKTLGQVTSHADERGAGGVPTPGPRASTLLGTTGRRWDLLLPVTRQGADHKSPRAPGCTNSPVRRNPAEMPGIPAGSGAPPAPSDLRSPAVRSPPRPLPRRPCRGPVLGSVAHGGRGPRGVPECREVASLDPGLRRRRGTRCARGAGCLQTGLCAMEARGARWRAAPGVGTRPRAGRGGAGSPSPAHPRETAGSAPN